MSHRKLKTIHSLASNSIDSPIWLWPYTDLLNFRAESPMTASRFPGCVTAWQEALGPLGGYFIRLLWALPTIVNTFQLLSFVRIRANSLSTALQIQVVSSRHKILRYKKGNHLQQLFHGSTWPLCINNNRGQIRNLDQKVVWFSESPSVANIILPNYLPPSKNGASSHIHFLPRPLGSYKFNFSAANIYYLWWWIAEYWSISHPDLRYQPQEYRGLQPSAQTTHRGPTAASSTSTSRNKS